MSKASGWSVLRLVLLLAATSVVEGQLVTWNLANFSYALPVVRNLALLGDASIDNTTARLVLNARAGVATAGRALYSNKVQFKRDTTSFSTNFTFAITNPGVATCGGFTFHIREDNNSSALMGSGQYLGLTSGAGESVFAVEFDTAQDADVGDPSASHMGVDVNGVKSTATYNLPTGLVNAGVFFTKISYNGSRDSLQVQLQLQNAGTLIADWTVANASLRSVLQEFMYVGFSGSNGVGCNQKHEILSWGFSTSRSLGVPGATVTDNCDKLDGCSNYRALVIGIPAAVGGAAILLLLVLLYCCCYRKKQLTQPVASDGKASGPASATRVDAPPDVEPCKLPVPPLDLPLYKSTRGENAADSRVGAPIAKTAIVAATKAVEPKAVAPVAEPTNRNANDKVTLCCVATKAKRDYDEPVVFSLKELVHATKGFSEKEVIGGARRLVYRGVLRDSGAVVAIKEIALDNISDEFVEKATALGRIRHPNLVHLLGWCKAADKGKLYLVYEYMPRGSLDKLLLRKEGLGFEVRHSVLVGVAAGLTYLHEEWEKCVLHRDVKPSNVLLDANLTPHLGNFSHASLVDHNQLAESTIMDGTLGYMAPELPFTGKPTVKSDVFSFGILALSVACGRLPLDWQVEDRVLLDSVWRAHADNAILRVVDSKLANNFNENQMITLLQLALWCAHPDPSARPTMALVWQTLIGRAKPPELPATKPEVADYAALSSNHGVARSLRSRNAGTVPPIRFPGMDWVP